MGRTPITQIDTDRCTGCGACIEICPSGTLSLVEGKASVTGDDSMACCHCVAVCPEDAVTLPGIAPPPFETLAENSAAASLVDVMRRRRSIRVYRDTPVDAELLKDIVHAGILAPSGTNSQK